VTSKPELILAYWAMKIRLRVTRILSVLKFQNAKYVRFPNTLSLRRTTLVLPVEDYMLAFLQTSPPKMRIQ